MVKYRLMFVSQFSVSLQTHHHQFSVSFLMFVHQILYDKFFFRPTSRAKISHFLSFFMILSYIYSYFRGSNKVN